MKTTSRNMTALLNALERRPNDLPSAPGWSSFEELSSFHGPEEPLVEVEAESTGPRHAAQRLVFPKIGICSHQEPEPDVLKYLTEDRGLSLPVIQEAWGRQLIGFLPSDPHQCTELLSREVGKDLLKDARFWKSDRSMPSSVGRPLVFFLPGLKSAEFRLARPEREGELKAMRYGSGNIPWFWRGASGETAVVEGLIDMLSLVDAGWEGHILGYHGRMTWSVQHFELFEQAHGQQKFAICFDGDSIGRRSARILAGAMSDKGIDGEVIAVPAGLDINKMLVARQR
jgi:hypothetical protein